MSEPSLHVDRIEPPPMRPILATLALLAILPVVFLLTGVPATLAVPVMAVDAFAVLLYGGYWAMRIVHIDRANKIERINETGWPPIPRPLPDPPLPPRRSI